MENIWLFFFIAFVASFFVRPDFYSKLYQSFNWMTWIKPDNQNPCGYWLSWWVRLNPLPTLIELFQFYASTTSSSIFIQLIILLVWYCILCIMVFGILIINGQDIYQSTIMDFYKYWRTLFVGDWLLMQNSLF